MNQHFQKTLFLGPCTNHNHPEQTGGAIVLFENMLEQCRKNGLNFQVIDTNKRNYFHPLIAYISIALQLLRYQRDAYRISYHSSRDYMILGVLVVLIGRLFNKPTSLRKFGGEAFNVYHQAGPLKRFVLRFIFTRIDILFFEMKHLVEHFKPMNPNTFWFPNVRQQISSSDAIRTFSKRFVFISHVKHDKGVDEILEASNKLDSTYTIDIYGPISEAKYTPAYFSHYKARYQRALPSSEVIEVLNTYDILLLPTFYKGEGYPGIILEAYSLGIPVITTTLKGIQEITENQQTGLLISPQNVDELVSAIRYFNYENYSPFSTQARKYFDTFDSDIQSRIFFERIGAL